MVKRQCVLYTDRVYCTLPLLECGCSCPGLEARQHIGHRGVKLVLAAFGLPVDGDDARQRRKQRRLQLAHVHSLGVRRVVGEAPKRLAQLNEPLRI